MVILRLLWTKFQVMKEKAVVEKENKKGQPFDILEYHSKQRVLLVSS